MFTVSKHLHCSLILLVSLAVPAAGQIDNLAPTETSHPADRKDLIKGYALDSFAEYFEVSERQKEILEFARAQLESKSPKSRKAAKELLKTWDETR